MEPARAAFRGFDMAVEQVGMADEAGGEAGRGPVVEIGWRADLFNAGLVHQADAVGHGQGFVLVVRDVDEGGLQFRMQVADFELHVFAQLLVQRAQRLVQQDHRRAIDKAARQRDALLLPAGQLARVAVRVLVHLDHRQRRATARLSASAGARRMRRP